MSHKVYNKPILDKLGVKAGSCVAVIGIQDAGFLRKLRDRTGSTGKSLLRGRMDIVFLGADSEKELGRLGRMKRFIRPDGAIWVVSRKGSEATIKDVEVIAAAKSAGLTDNKVVAFSETHTALRLVIPRSMR